MDFSLWSMPLTLISLWGGRSKIETTFEKQQKHLEQNRVGAQMDRLGLAAARDTWGKHPRELIGAPWDKFMLLDMMAIKDWEVKNLVIL